MSFESIIDTGKPQPGDRCAWYLRVSTMLGVDEEAAGDKEA